MKPRSILLFGHPILRKTGKPVTEFGAPLKALFEEMVAACTENGGAVGLAAQQLGEDLQFFILNSLANDRRRITSEAILDGKPVPLDLLTPMGIANAEIIEASPEMAVCDDGCMSFPGIWGPTLRHSWVCIRFQDLDGNYHTLKGADITAFCIQHEYDHNQGVLFIDRMEPRIVKRLETKIKQLKRDTLYELKAKKQYPA